MNLPILFLFALLLLSSCSGTSQQHTGIDSLQQNTGDSTQNPANSSVSLSPQLTEAIAEFPELSLPIKVDSTNFKPSSPLPKNALRMLLKAAESEQYGALHYYMKAYKKLQNIENESFDIGDIVKMDLFAYGKLAKPVQDMTVVFVSLNYQSYEACPSSSGDLLFVCLLDSQGKLITSERVYENTAGADPPVAGSTYYGFVSENGSAYQLKGANIDEDIDANTRNVTPYTQTLSIAPGKIISANQ